MNKNTMWQSENGSVFKLRDTGRVQRNAEGDLESVYENEVYFNVEVTAVCKTSFNKERIYVEKVVAAERRIALAEQIANMLNAADVK